MQSDEPTLPESLEESLLRAGFSEDAGTTSLIRSSLESDQARLRVLALRAGLRRSLIDANDWVRALDDADRDVRREALEMVARANVDDPRICDSILRLLDDADPLVVDAAAFALGEHSHAPAVERLSLIATGHDDARCRESAVAALGAIGDDRGRAAILAALEDKPPVRRRAIVALTNFAGPDIDDALARASEDRDWQVRAAVSQLAREEP